MLFGNERLAVTFTVGGKEVLFKAEPEAGWWVRIT